MYKLLKQENRARRGEFHTVHGTIQTPAFMNVATAAAIKGGLSAYDLREIKCQVMLSNTYHLHLRPGDENVRKLGGIHKFTGWQGPVLTDSGGFQVFSLAKLRNIREEGVTFASHIDGHRIFMGPEESMRIQSNLGSTIAMAFDECMQNPAEYDYARNSCARTVRWLQRCKTEHDRLNAAEGTVNPHQMLFGINQGSTYADLRIEHMKAIAELDLDGYAIGGLAVGEPTEEMYRIIEAVEPHMPKNKIRYLMGVGTPANILEAVYRGVDLFDCVMPESAERQVYARRPADRPGVRLPGLPAPFPRVYPPPVQGRRDAGHAPDRDAQPVFLQQPDGAYPRCAGRRHVPVVLRYVRAGARDKDIAGHSGFCERYLSVLKKFTKEFGFCLQVFPVLVIIDIVSSGAWKCTDTERKENNYDF